MGINKKHQSITTQLTYTLHCIIIQYTTLCYNQQPLLAYLEIQTDIGAIHSQQMRINTKKIKMNQFFGQ